ncbi:MAG: RIO1 family regulatory kinase/ATPase [Nakamurella sp.]
MPIHGTRTTRHPLTVPTAEVPDRGNEDRDNEDRDDKDPGDPDTGDWDKNADWDDDSASFEKFRSATTSTRRRVVVEGRSGRREVADAEIVLVPDPPGAPGIPVHSGEGRPGAPSATPAAYSTYDTASHGPEPVPAWVVTSFSAIDTPLGILKSGKEADVHLLDRSLPVGASSVLAVKTYRSSDHRMFHRDSGYQEGRRTRRTREGRAMAARTSFGRELLAGQWAAAEFAALSTFWTAGAPVPYPVQLIGSELMMEFVGDDAGAAAPRLATAGVPGGVAPAEVFTPLWHDLVATLELVASLGYTHGDLSPYNVLVADGRCVLIDLPQIVDVIANPQGPAFLARDATVIADFFRRKGVAGADGDLLTARLAGFAGL